MIARLVKTTLTIPVSLSLTLTLACGGTSEPPATPASCPTPDATASSEVAPPSRQGALPRYFTLELHGKTTQIDGKPLRGHDLSVRIDTEAKDERNGGALVRLHEEFSGEVLGALVWELSTAGFEHIIVWRRDSGDPPLEAPAQPPAPAAPAPPEPVARAPEAVPGEPTPAAAPVTPAPDVEPDASLRTIGLHVGGGPNDDATRGKFIAPIEQQFDALLRCHALAQDRNRNASVGVDLLIPVRGGKASVKDLRTALGSPEFQACIQAAFEQVSFPSVARPTMISYSMLFEPSSKR